MQRYFYNMNLSCKQKEKAFPREAQSFPINNYAHIHVAVAAAAAEVDGLAEGG